MKRYFISREACPVCGSTKGQCLFSCPFNKEPVRGYISRVGYVNPDYDLLAEGVYRLLSCPVCGLIFQQEIPNEELAFSLYEKWLDAGEAWERHARIDDLAYYKNYAFEIMFLIDLLGKMPNDIEVLDYGLGLGKWARMAQAFGCCVSGVELSPSRAAMAKRSGIEIVHLDRSSGRLYDIINLDQVLEHVPQPLEMLSLLSQHLKPNGFIKICVPDGGDVEKRLAIGDWQAPRHSSSSLVAVAPLEHINCFNVKSLGYLVTQAGLQKYNIEWSKFFSLPLMEIILPLNINKKGWQSFQRDYRYFRRGTWWLVKK